MVIFQSNTSCIKIKVAETLCFESHCTLFPQYLCTLHCQFTMNRDSKSQYTIFFKNKKWLIFRSVILFYTPQYPQSRHHAGLVFFTLKKITIIYLFYIKLWRVVEKSPVIYFIFHLYVVPTCCIYSFYVFYAFLDKIPHKAVWATICGSSSIVLALLCSPPSQTCEQCNS